MSNSKGVVPVLGALMFLILLVVLVLGLGGWTPSSLFYVSNCELVESGKVECFVTLRAYGWYKETYVGAQAYVKDIPEISESNDFPDNLKVTFTVPSEIICRTNNCNGVEIGEESGCTKWQGQREWWNDVDPRDTACSSCFDPEGINMIGRTDIHCYAPQCLSWGNWRGHGFDDVVCGGAIVPTSRSLSYFGYPGNIPLDSVGYTISSDNAILIVNANIPKIATGSVEGKITIEYTPFVQPPTKTCSDYGYYDVIIQGMTCSPVEIEGLICYDCYTIPPPPPPTNLFEMILNWLTTFFKSLGVGELR